MNRLNSSVLWYQCKIGEHDKQTWEQTVEGKILNSIENLPRKDATKERRELLDIELIKGSTFTKAKPSHSLYARTWKGLVRMVFMPFFFKWWILHTSVAFLTLSLLLYTAQVCVAAIFYYFSDQVTASTSFFEVTNPLLFMFVLSVIHTQIVFTQSSTKRALYKKAHPTRLSPMSQSVGTASKRSKKVLIKQVKLVKRKSRVSGTSRISISESQPVTAAVVDDDAMSNMKKISSDSSEDVEDSLLRGDDSYVDTTDLVDDMDDDDDGMSSEEGSGPLREGSRVRVEIVPDVAADAENKISEGSRQSSRPSTPSTASSPTVRKVPAGAAANDGASKTRRQVSSDVSEYQANIYVTDTDWESNSGSGTSKSDQFPNWVNNSDVASESTSEDCESEDVESKEADEHLVEGPICLKPKVSHTLAYVPSVYDRISCIIWEDGECKKVDLSVPDLGALIERRAAQLEYEPMEMLCIATLFTLLIASFPFLFRIYHSERLKTLLLELPFDYNSLNDMFTILCGSTWQERLIVFNGFVQRICLFGTFSFLVLVAERSYWQRLQFAKYFLCLTSARKSKKYDIPHFRLNKVKNIKVWLSLRAYLKKRGPQRSVEVIVCSVFILMVCFLGLMCVQLLSDVDAFIQVYGNWELTLCCAAMTLYLLRFYSLGTKITKKYRCLSTLITEQINLYLHMEQKPAKKDELLVANCVLKLAEELIKELESPYKMSSTVINPVVFNVIRLVMLSAFSAVVSELLGFKLKLYKVKI